MFVTERSAEFVMNVLTVTLLLPPLGSLVPEITVSVCVMDPAACVAGTDTVKVKAIVVFCARFPVSWQVSVPKVQVQPVGPVRPVAVKPAGKDSTSFGVVAAAGPLFVTV